jgi:phosphonate transport system substrate-binding protein
MFRDLNENDTRAALKLYATVLGSANDLIVSESPGIFTNAAAIADAFANGTADVASMTVQEYLAVPSNLISPRLLAASIANNYTEEYILLVHADSGIVTLAGLRGRRLIMYNSLRGWISPLWLDVMLANQGYEAPSRFFSRVSFANKPTRTVLPVFFHQEDACIVTRHSYDVICELNPQLQKQLRVLAASPGYVPHLTCFRASISPEIIDRMIKAAVAAQDTVNGKQILTIFQCDRIAEITPEKLASVRELLADQARLRTGTDTDTAAIKPEPPATR